MDDVAHNRPKFEKSEYQDMSARLAIDWARARWLERELMRSAGVAKPAVQYQR
jgi:hypothetical protein